MKLIVKIALGIMLAVVLLGVCTAALVSQGAKEVNEQAHTVQVDAAANVCWSGSIGGSTKEGCGPASFDVKGIQGSSAVVQNKGKGLLTVVMLSEGKEVARESSSAEFGVVSVTAPFGK